MTDAPGFAIAVIGIGNELAGDDGAGLEVIRRLQPAWQGDSRVLLGRLEGDLYAVADLLPLAAEFVFVDAVAGPAPGHLVYGSALPRAFAPSHHQTDIGTVLRMLKKLGIADPFPPWMLWGVTIELPRELRAGLSDPVASAVDRLAAELHSYLLLRMRLDESRSHR